MQPDLFPTFPRPSPGGSAPGDIAALQALVQSNQRFACIYADPPWPYRNRRTRGAVDYQTLPVAQIKALPVGPLALPQAHLHLWVTNSFLREGLDVVTAWGFEYKTMFTWVKPLGTGNYWRVSTEHLLLGVRGKLRFQDKSLRNWIYLARGKPSRKPDQIRRLIEKASPGPYLELFGRDAVDGWTVWGNEIGRTLWSP